jgi:hypothetical protein
MSISSLVESPSSGRSEGKATIDNHSVVGDNITDQRDVMDGMLVFLEEEACAEEKRVLREAGSAGTAGDDYYYSYDDEDYEDHDEYEDELWLEEQLLFIKDLLKEMIPNICYGWGILCTTFLLRKWVKHVNFPAVQFPGMKITL